MKPRIVLLISVLVIAGGIALWWYVSTSPGTALTGAPVLASGFIEDKEVAVTPEVGGRIVAIAADEGDEVKAGAALVTLDDSLLQAQQREADSAIATAQAAVEQAQASVEQAQAAVEQARAAAEQADMSRKQTVVYQDGARKLWENALDVQKNPLELEARIIAAQGELNTAEVGLEYEREQTLNFAPGPKSLYWSHALAKASYDSAGAVLQSLLDIKNNPQAINAEVDRTRATYDTAAAAVAVAERAAAVAQGAVGVAQKQVTVAQKHVAVAQRQAEQARAAAAVIKVQTGKMVLTSPLTGVVSARNAEPGEMAQPGASILTVTALEEVTLTVYVAESKIGLVKLGQAALVSVDSYPGESFAGRVVYISPRALFTPKDIQMKEEREKTVFPVKIRLPNPERKLKPGMPADAQIR